MFSMNLAEDQTEPETSQSTTILPLRGGFRRRFLACLSFWGALLCVFLRLRLSVWPVLHGALLLKSY